MDNRTIRRALTRRVPEIYFVDAPLRYNGKIAWALLANINGRPYKLVADMPETALVSHTELLNTMVSEVYDGVDKIKRKAYTPPIAPGEDGIPPLSDEDLRMMGYRNVEDKILDTGIMPEMDISL